MTPKRYPLMKINLNSLCVSTRTASFGMQLLMGIAIGGLLTTSAMAKSGQTFESGSSPATLLELYTSEGCSSCPPAEAWLSGFKKDPGLWTKTIPLSFHVDYWDGLGWSDQFAKKPYTERQRNYAAQLGSDSVYTPEFITNGKEWKGWFRRESLPSVSRPVTPGSLKAILTSAQQAEIHYDLATNRADSLQLEVALLGFDLISDVHHGENSGRKLAHDFVVLHLEEKKLNQGHPGSVIFDLPTQILQQAGAIAVWIQDTRTGNIVQSVGGWLEK